MRKTSLCIVALACLAVSGTIFGGNKETGEGELKKIQGTWKFISQEMDGKEVPKEQLAGITITFKDDTWTVRMKDMVLQAGTHKFDPSKKPGQVDARVTEGEGKGTTMLGIFERKGDKMKVCFDTKGKERPTTFTTKEGQFSAVVQREKNKE